jgi:hypothetical protein
MKRIQAPVGQLLLNRWIHFEADMDMMNTTKAMPKMTDGDLSDHFRRIRRNETQLSFEMENNQECSKIDQQFAHEYLFILLVKFNFKVFR